MAFMIKRHCSAFWVLMLLCLSTLAQADAPLPTLRIQLGWIDQAQYAGFYVAEKKGYFAAEGLNVITLPGATDVDPMKAMSAGQADVVVAQLSAALRNSSPDHPLTNIAQIFHGSPLLLMCRASADIHRLEDVVGKTIGVANWGDGDIVKAMLKTVTPQDTVTRYVPRGDSGTELVDRSADCISGMTYNEYHRVIEAGVPAQDLLLFHPESYGINDTEDGLYVFAHRLKDPAFVDQLARLVRALKHGWEEARQHPASTVTLVLQQNPSLDRVHQAQMLESVIELLPEKDIGYFDLDSLRQVDWPREQRDGIWTHAVWNRLQELDNNRPLITRATLYYAKLAQQTEVFHLVLLFGICFFALAGSLNAIQQGYDLWGRLIIALVSALGGGILRDLFIGGPRLPFEFLQHPTLPAAVLSVVVVISGVVAGFPAFCASRSWQHLTQFSKSIGFGILTTFGAMVPISAGLEWYWAPVCAAMTCAGGGIISDIICNREPRNFSGKIYEEVAVVGALLLVLGLVVASRFEHSSTAVNLVFVATAIVAGALLYFVDKYQIRYPRWLAQPGRSQDRLPR